jgi:hypothetical protein
MSFLHLHVHAVAPCPRCISKSKLYVHVHGACPCLCLCCMTFPCYVSMSIYAVSPCPSCMSMSMVPLPMLHVRFHATCPYLYCISMLNVRAACPCCMIKHTRSNEQEHEYELKNKLKNENEHGTRTWTRIKTWTWIWMPSVDMDIRILQKYLLSRNFLCLDIVITRRQFCVIRRNWMQLQKIFDFPVSKKIHFLDTL